MQMIFRMTQKAMTKLQLTKESIVSISDCSPMSEWYCNVVTVQRKQFFLLTQATTLFSFWMPAARIKKANFGHEFRDWASQVLADYGFGMSEVGVILQDDPDVFTKSVDRSVTGSMVDYAKMLLYVTKYNGGLENIGLRKMNDIANECPMSKIGMKRPVGYLREQLNARGSSFD
jgi:hypothetical protein